MLMLAYVTPKSAPSRFSLLELRRAGLQHNGACKPSPAFAQTQKRSTLCNRIHTAPEGRAASCVEYSRSYVVRDWRGALSVRASARSEEVAQMPAICSTEHASALCRLHRPRRFVVSSRRGSAQQRQTAVDQCVSSSGAVSDCSP